jgi:sn-glycerol 3-phosphate transport system ATP-binding protein
MDEPLSNLDAQLRQEMRQEIRQLQRELGITMVYVTHDQVEAMTMADRVILLSAGRIEQNGTPVELYETPANIFVARFIGTPPMNLLPLAAGAGGAVIAGTLGPAVAPAELSGATLGVRPEHVALGRETGVEAQVETLEYLGADSLITCRIGAHAFAARVAGRTGLTSGDRTRVSWVSGAQHFFDEANGSRMEFELRHHGATMLA